MHGWLWRFRHETEAIPTHDRLLLILSTVLQTSETSGQVIFHLESVFSIYHYGIHSTVMSDGGLQFSIAAFQRFAEVSGSDYSIISSPCYNLSNGIAENGVKMSKRLLTKAAEKGD